jgi:predicted nucleic acid-binding protein
VAWAYFDSSALVKRYVNETGRREALRLLRQYEVVTSALAPVELRSAFRRRVADGGLDAARLPDVLSRLAAERAFWALVEVSRESLAGAEALVAAHPIRALDAIHLASAQMFATRIGAPRLPFVSADARQTAVAAAVGLTPRHIAV